MTENKRFTFGGTDEEPLVRDNITGKEYPTEENSLMELLNELNDENNDLRFDFKEMKGLLHSLEDEIEKLERENKELKEINQDHQDHILLLEEEKINLQIKLQKIRDYAMENGEVKQDVIEKVVFE